MGFFMVENAGHIISKGEWADVGEKEKMKPTGDKKKTSGPLHLRRAGITEERKRMATWAKFYNVEKEVEELRAFWMVLGLFCCC